MPAPSATQVLPDADLPQHLTLLTPGVRQALVTEQAVRFLASEQLATAGLNYAQAELSAALWEVVLVEVPEKTGFAGYKYRVQLSDADLRVVHWEVLSKQ